MEKAAALRAAVGFYWAKAQGLFIGWKGKAIAASLVLVIVAGYAHHLGAAGKADLKAQVRQLKEDLAQADERAAKPAPQPEIPYWQCNGPKETRHPKCPDDSAADQRAVELKTQLAESEEAKANLEKKVKDYETQLAHRPAKGGSHKLSPADARSLSNIR
jgi:hypothetical protein